MPKKFYPRYGEIMDVINERGFETAAEIGVFQGKMSEWLLTHCPSLKTLYLIDPYKQYYGKRLSQNQMDKLYSEVKERLSKYPAAKMIRKPSVEAASEISEVDLAFIDGDHSYEHVKADINAWLPKIRKGGVLSGHDYIFSCPGVVNAVTEAFEGKAKILPGKVWLVEI
jgi:predicted O-methyltransferase YrrM